MISMNTVVFLLSETLMNSQTLIFVGLGGLICERSGIINIGLEGMMTLGAFVGVTAVLLTGNPWLALLVGGLSGSFLAFFHAIFTVYLRSNQVITGTALNFLGPSVAMILGSMIFGSTSTVPIDVKLPIFLASVLDKSSILFQIFGKSYSVYLAILSVIFFHIFFKYTKLGLRIKASGEDPEVLGSLGVNVFAIRFWCVITSGFLTGVGGAVLTTVITSSYIQGIVGGQGFIAIVVLIFGRWTAVGVLLGSFLFSFLRTLSIFLNQVEFVSGFLSTKFLIISPYVVMIISLMILSSKTPKPKSLGLPYMRD